MYDEITLNLTSSIKKSCPIIPYLHHSCPSNSFLRLLVPSMLELFHVKSLQTYIIMYLALAKTISNSILRPTTPLAYKFLQHIITEDDSRRMIEYVLPKWVPRLDVKAGDM